jgi:hypothetical protein
MALKLLSIGYQNIQESLGIKADTLSKVGTAMTQIATNANLHTCKQILINNYIIEWLNQWASAKTS